MEDNKGDIQVTPPVTTEDKKIETPPAPSQNPLDTELNKAKAKTEGRSKLEKLIFTKKRVEQQIEEERKAAGLEPEIIEDDNAPVTVGMLKQMEREKAARTAVEMAEDIEDEKERELTKHHLQNTIRSSGNPKEDFRTARMLVNAARTAQIATEAGRKTTPRSYVTGAGAPPLETQPFEPTPDEAMMMGMKGLDGKPLLTKEDIIKARK